MRDRNYLIYKKNTVSDVDYTRSGGIKECDKMGNVDIWEKTSCWKRRETSEE